jgi:predicted DsbA family dithiol-disulfide isomerase
VVPPDPTKPKSRFELFCEAEKIQLPSPRPGFVRTHAALLGAEWAKSVGVEAFDTYNTAVYRAYWEQCANIEDIATLAHIAQEAGLDSAALTESIIAERFADQILPFDDPAYAAGIRHVPTFLFGAEEQLAEAHYVELAYATERFLLRKPV